MTASPVSPRRRRARPVPLVGIIMGSRSDWPTLAPAARLLAARGISCEVRVVSAHRTPALLYRYARGAARRGLRCLIAGAGGAAHLPGMAAALTPLPVLGVPVRSRALDGWDSLLSILQMPAGIPVATFRVGPEGAVDAARFAAVLATGWPPAGHPPPAPGQPRRRRPAAAAPPRGAGAPPAPAAPR